jgi:ABC-type glutathione transport system ATPase component
VNLILRAGRTLALIGESGSGKTTLAMCLAALERPDKGEIWLDDCDLASAADAQLAKTRSQIQILFQDSAGALSPLLTASEIVEEPLRIQNVTPKSHFNARVLELFHHAGLSPDLQHRRIHELSGGQRQRLAIARALALSPRLMILDEPFAGLDLSARGQIINLLLELQAVNDIAYLYISHELDVVRHFADEVAVIHDGRIVELGRTDVVLRHPTHTRTRVLFDAYASLHAPRSHSKGEAACATC